MRMLVAVVVALVLGVGLGAGVVLALEDEHAAPTTDAAVGEEVVVERATGTLEAVPPAPLEVIAETVRLGNGFAIRHTHGGPTFNFVRSGTVVIEDPGESPRSFGAGQFFFEPADFEHVIRVEGDTRIDVLRLIPPGAPETTDLG